MVLALKSSIEAEATSMYISKILKNKNIKVTRISYGIPMGAEIDYLDPHIRKSNQDRKTIS